MRNWIDIARGLDNNEPLMEAAITKVMPMFNAFPPAFTENAKDQIQQVVDVFKGNNQRLVWAMKWFRLHMAHFGLGHTVLGKDLSHKLTLFFMQKDFPTCNNGEDADDITSLSVWRHFFNLGLPEIQNYQYGSKKPREVLDDFLDFENEFKKASSQQVRRTGNEEILIDFKDGYVWMDLRRAGCPQEAAAMGHCGNGSGRNGDTVLSLRKHIRDDIYRPCLTFILNNGMLGEMKGRGNDKPAQRYHKYIVALLKHERVEGIKGGGYMPENNFKVTDLPTDEREALMTSHPHLESIESVFETYYDCTFALNQEKQRAEAGQDPLKTEEEVEKLTAMQTKAMGKLEEMLHEFHGIDWDDEEIIIKSPIKFDDIDYEYGGDFFGWRSPDEMSEELQDELEIGRELADEVANFFAADIEDSKQEYAQLLTFDNYHVTMSEVKSKWRGLDKEEKWAPVIDLRQYFWPDDMDDEEAPLHDPTSLCFADRIDEYIKSRYNNDNVHNWLLRLYYEKDEGTKVHNKDDITYVHCINTMKRYQRLKREEDMKDQLSFDFMKDDEESD